jgi:hypothetical protein
MQVGDVAHVDDAEAQSWQAGHSAGQQAFHDLDGLGKVATEDRPEHHGGIHGGERRGTARGTNQIPGGSLGQGLGAGVSTYLGIVEIGPVGSKN